MSDATRLSKGIIRDVGYINHPPENPRFALNAVRATQDGDMYAYQSEPGNILIKELDKTVIGHIYGKKGENYIFSTDNITSEIGLLKHDNYIKLAELDLGFNTCNQIVGTFQVKNECDRILYWCDGLNPDYYFNVDKPDLFKTNGVFDPNKFKLRSDILPSYATPVEVLNGGGSMEVGLYYFQAEVLDSSFNVISRGYISTPVAVYDEPVNSSYINIDGAYPSSFPSAIGGTGPVSKSIRVELSNLDTSFKYVRLNVIRAITGDGFTVDVVKKGNLIPITSDTIQTTFTGYNPSNGDILTDYASLTQANAVYETSNYMLQVQNRLVRANVTEPYIDYSLFQKAANQIASKYVVDEVENVSQYDEGNPKNPLTWTNKLSHMGDEVYAYSIVYLFNSGYESPAFHIPGRSSIPTDTNLLTVVASGAPAGSTTVTNLSNVRHLGLEVGDQVEYWKVFNTADTTTRIMSYYEDTETNYPLDTDCNGEYIFGDLAGTPIRHHKFPDRRKELLFNNNKFRLLGIQFENITYPHPDIVGHYFVRAKRDDFNKTVLDTGLITGMRYNEQEDYYYYGQIDSTNGSAAATNNLFKAAIFPTHKFYKEVRQGDHLKFIGQYVAASTDSVSYVEDVGDYNYTLFMQNTRVGTGGSIEVTNTHNRSYDGLIGLDYSTTQTATQGFTDDVVNSSLVNDIVAVHLLDEIGLSDFDYPDISKSGVYLVSNKITKNVYSNLFSLVYYRTHNDIKTLTSDQKVFGGDVFISPVLYMELFSETITDNPTPPDVYAYAGNYFTGAAIESEINWSMRHEGTDLCNVYYQGGSFMDYWLPKFTVLLDDQTRVPRSEICSEFYAYNKDYSRGIQDTVYFPLPLGYNYCSKCLNEYPNRIIYSPTSFTQELSNSYKVNFVDDYIDTPADRGSIINMAYKSNQLLVHLEQTSYIYKPNPQFVSTDQGSAYLQTGDFLAIPPDELVQTDTGYGGCQHKLSNERTEFGYYWPDETGGKVLSWSNEMSDISLRGLSYWFQENLPVSFLNIYQQATGEEYPCQSTSDPNGVGIITIYDPFFKRIIIHKKDFEPVVPLAGKPAFDKLYYNPETNVFIYEDTAAQQSIVANTSDPKYFKNKSFTISYDLKEQFWTSWHSYLPTFMFNDEAYFYTVKDNTIYKHLKRGNYQTFYDKKYDFIIELINSDLFTKDLHSIFYIALTKQWNENTESWRIIEDITFDRIMAYTETQSTGVQSLILQDQHNDPYGYLFYDNITKKVIKTDNNHKVSGLYDISIDHPVVSSSWSDISSTYFIDHVSYDANIDYNKSVYDYKEMKDKYLAVRLFFNPVNDYKKTIYFANSNRKESIR